MGRGQVEAVDVHVHDDGYLEVEDDGPDESEHHGGPPVHHVAGVDVDQLDLQPEVGMV